MLNIRALADGITQPWQPVVVDEANGFQLKVVRLLGEFPWHVHELEDELFVCYEGEFRIEREGEPAVPMRPGDTYVVPAGRRHRPVAAQEAVALLLERAETKQYGD